MTILDRARKNRVNALAALIAHKKASNQQDATNRDDGFARLEYLPTGSLNASDPSGLFRMAA